MKPIIKLDLTLPANHEVPIHPETKKIWTERYEELFHLSAKYQRTTNPADRAVLESQFETLRDGLQFVVVPYIVGNYITHHNLGITLNHYSCHPDTWNRMSPDEQAEFILWSDPLPPA